MARLTAELIVSAAIAVIEEVGAERFSVRKLGRALDADPTSIYRHFDSKDDLLRAVGDRGLVGLTDDLPPDSWGECIRQLCIRLRAANLAQPMLASLVRSAPPRHGNELLITETLLAQLSGAGFGATEATSAYHALIELTIGSAAIDAAMTSLPPGERVRAYESWRADYATLDPQEFPVSVQMAPSLYPGDADERFIAALDLMLLGLELALARGGARRQ